MLQPNKEILDKILFLWNKNKGKSFLSFISENKDVNDYLESLVNSDNWFKNKKRAFVCVANGIYKKVTCKTCGKEIDLIKACKGRVFCSRSCSSKYVNKNRIYTKETNQKSNRIRKETNIKRYGVSCPMQSSEIRNKYKNTCIEKFGTDNPLKDKQIQIKRRKTLMNNYNVDFPFQSEEIRNKSRETNLKRYGVESIFLSDKFKNKIKNTIIEKYGII